MRMEWDTVLQFDVEAFEATGLISQHERNDKRMLADGFIEKMIIALSP